ncbi:hypothetical protein GQ54DRAFT_300105 [Martensiomyces pterosporus]|nr:hypothetical protein GQ54DRAFT_300105 [Martensiomyces pterosporus]
MRTGCLPQQYSSAKHRSSQHRRFEQQRSTNLAPCPRIPIAGTHTCKPGEHHRVAAQPTLSSVGGG